MSEFTVEQNKVINHFGSNMLVSASAGSGKTKTLIEKIIKILSDEMAKVKDLLVVTFTNAACDEIKQRLRKKFVESNSQKLFDQIDDLSVCDILTFDSFCKKIVEEFGYQIGVGNGFGVADKNLSDFLKSRAMDGLIEKHNQMQDSEYMSVLNMFFEKRNDKNFRETIIKFHEYVTNHNDFNFYRNLLEKNYDNDIDNIFAVKYLTENCDVYVQNFKNQLQNLVLQAQMLNDEKLASKIEETSGILDLFKGDYFEKKYVFFDLFKPKIISSYANKDSVEILEIKEKYKLYLADFKQYMSKVFKEDLKLLDKKQIAEILQIDKGNLKAILNLTEEFDGIYADVKKKYNVLDFVDLEKYALEILQSKAISSALQEKYKYIFVDEFQDTSKLQNQIIDLVSNGKNLTMVGDVKQSIYRYRNAEPKIFIDIYDKYNADNKNRVFELNKNFRSERKILQFVNFVFDTIMKKNIDGVDYKNTSKLLYGEKILSCENENNVEVLLIDKQKAKDEEKRFEYYSVKNAELVTDDSKNIEKEAMLAVMKIRECLYKKKYWNVETKQFEQLDYKDIAILTRDKKNVILKVKNILNKCGLPVKCKFDDNLLNNFDVELLISIIKLIENSQDDKSLLIVLSSIVGKLSFDELSKIKQFDSKSKFFYECIRNYTANNDDEIAKKIQSVYAKLENYKIISHSLDICELILKIVKNEKLDEYFWLNGYGEEFDEHVRLLISKYQSIKDYSLSEFVSYIETFKEQTVENQISDGDNAVTITTIHGSKGLEYPVVILLQSEKNFSLRPSSIYCDETFGLTINSIDFEERTKFENIVLTGYKLSNLEEEKKDEKRLLYVALTRAKNYLFVIGFANIDNIKSIKNDFDLKNAKNYIEWIVGGLNENEISILQNRGKFTKKFEDTNINFSVLSSDEIVLNVEKKQKAVESVNSDNKDFVEIINKKFHHSNLAKKNSVSQIMAEEDHYNISDFSAYKNEKSGEDDFLLIGNLYHKIMQHINFVNDENDLKNQIEKMVENGVILQSDLQIVDIEKIIIACKIIAEIINPDDIVLKEQQFLCYMPANELVKTTENQRILVQGVADLIVIKPNEIILVDYKTSRLKNQADFEKKYKTQLDIYAKAIEDFYDRPVTKKLIYSFYLDKLLTIWLYCLTNKKIKIILSMLV